MSTLPAIDLDAKVLTGVRRLTRPQAAGVAAALAIVGLTSIRSTVLFLWDMWMTDALKSIGMLIPVVSLVLILRAWRSLDWEMEGSWWGVAILAVTIAAVHLRDQAVLILVLTPQWNIYLPPHSLVVFAYASGIVLLFGGTRLYRAALFPIALLWFVNPVPHFFNVLVDLPLQRVSAHVARAFAMALGQPLTPDQMRLMFTPSYGMFIAPGCNGIRGAVTMGFVALIAGYVYRFRWHLHAAVVAGAVLLGYLFNFARLCLLVVYYIVGLHLPRLQNRAKLADYIIGACLFFTATYLLFTVIRLLGTTAARAERTTAPCENRLPKSPTLRLAVMALVAVFGSWGTARAVAHELASDPSRSSTAVMPSFPQRIGGYKLERTWRENQATGALLFYWAQYASADGQSHISVGVAPYVGTHDTLICHSARGEDPLWRDEMNVVTANSRVVSMSGALFNNGAVQVLEASTICSGSHCGEYASDRSHFGLVYSKPDPYAVFSQDPQRPIPILLKTETLDTTLLPETAQRQLRSEMQAFLTQVDLDALVQPYRRK